MLNLMTAEAPSNIDPHDRRQGRAMTPSQTVLHVRIDRRRWPRGAICTTLRNPVSGHECIVGITARAAGVAAEYLEKHCQIFPTRDQPLPASLREFDTNRRNASWTEDPRAPERRFACRYLLYTINDDPLLGDAGRERMLTAVAARIGIELSFTGTALPPHAIPPTIDGRARRAAISRHEGSSSPGRRLQSVQQRPHPGPQLASAERDHPRSRRRPGGHLGLRV